MCLLRLGCRACGQGETLTMSRDTFIKTDDYEMELEYYKGFGWFMHFTIPPKALILFVETVKRFEQFKADLASTGLTELFAEVMDGDDKHTKFVLLYGGEPLMDNYVDGVKRSTIYRWEL